RRSLLFLRHRPRPAAYSALQCDEASCQLLGRSAIARGIPLRLCSRLPDLRSRCKLQSGSHRHGEDLRHPAEANQFPSSLAERGCRTLCRQLPPGSARPCDRAQRTALETSYERVHPLLPRGPNKLAAGEGTACSREAEKSPEVGGRVLWMPRLGGLHHRYDLAA